jgi:hypothetical protein
VEVRVKRQLAVGRLGHRGDADLAWETDLLRRLDRAGMPVPIPATDGRHFAEGLVVMTYQVAGCATGLVWPAGSVRSAG